MRKSAVVMVILLLISLPMLYITPYPTTNQTTKTTTTITAERAGGTPHIFVYLTNRNFTSGSGSSIDNWTYSEWGNNPSYATGGVYTSSYESSPQSAYLRLRSTSAYSLQCELGWTQPFTYTGTANITSALITFWWRCSSYTYAGSTNYMEIWFEVPQGSGNWVQAGSNIPFSSTTSWARRNIDITSLLRQWTIQYGAATYGFEADAYLTTSGSGAPDVRVLYDDIQIYVNYTTYVKPYSLTCLINAGATYAKSRNVNLTLGAVGADQMCFHNENNATWSTWETFSPTKQWLLSSGDGTKTVYFKAKNAAGESVTSANDTIIYDGSAPPAPKLQSPVNGTATNNNAPTFSWSTVTDVGPSGLATYSLDYSRNKTFAAGWVTTVSIPSGTTSYAPSSLSDGTWYWRVKAIDNAGNSGPYNGTNWFVVIDTVYPPGPTLTSPSTGSFTKTRSVTFVWNPSQDPSPSSGIASYTLQYSLDSSFTSGVTTVSGLTGTSYGTTLGSDGTWYWRVRAIDKAGNQGSYSSSSSVIVDTVAPNAPTLSSPTTGTNTNVNTPTFTWSAATDTSPSSGIASYSFQIDTSTSFNSVNLRTITGITGTSYTVSTALNDNTWYWRVNATDNAGNKGSYSGYWTIVVDTVAPGQPALSSPSNGTMTNVNTPTFTWSAASDPAPSSGIASYTLQVDTSSSFNSGNLRTITGLSLSYSVPGGSPLSDGTWYWRVRAIDNAGNTGSYSSPNRIIIVDTVNPNAPTLLTPSSGLITSNNKPTFTWTAPSDPAPSSGIASYTLQLDTSSSFSSGNLRTITGLTSTSYTVPTGSPLSDGTWYWHVRAVDNAGNLGSYSGYWTIVVDTVAPSQPALSSPSNGTKTNVNTPTFTWSGATDATSGVANYTLQLDTSSSFSSGNLRTINGVTSTSYTPGTALTDGTWYWRVRAVDRAGNAGSFSTYWNLVVDTVAPGQPTLSSPSSGTNTNVNTPTLTWSAATDPSPSSGITYTLQLDTSSSFSSGNLRTITGLTSTSYTVPGGSPLSDSTWYWRVKAVDNAGNTGSYSTYWSIVVDTVAPGLPTLTSPSTGSATNNNRPTFTWSAASDPAPSSGIASYTLQLDTSSSFNSGNLRTITGLTSTSYTPGTALTDGTWYWHVRAIDNAGNLGSYSGYWSVVVDIVAPGQPTLSSPSNGTKTNVNTPTFTWSAATDATSGVANYTLQIDTSSSFNSGNLRTINGLTATTYTPSTALIDSTWYWHVRAVDRAGNTGGYSTYWNIMVDTAAPSVPVPSAPTNGSTQYTGTPLFSWSAATDPSPSSGFTYTLQIDTSSSFNSGNLRTITGLTSTSYTIPGDSPLSDGTWYWHVRAVDNAGNTAGYSTTWSVVIVTSASGAPTLLSPSNGYETSNNQTAFTWTKVTAQNYTLYLDTTPFFNSTFDLFVKPDLTGNYTLSSGEARHDGTWYWKVGAQPGSKNSTVWSVVIDTKKPSAPTLSSPTNGYNANYATPTFTWSAATDPSPSSGVASYTLQLDTSASFDNATGKLRTITGITGTSYTVSTALIDGTWYWRVNATDGAGNLGSYSGSWSLIVDTVAPGLPTLSSPSAGTVTNVNTPTFTWVNATDATSGIASHTLQYSKDIKFLTGVVTVTGLGSSYTVPTGSPLSDGTWYWRVRAVDRAGNAGNYCANWSIVIDTVPPGLPTLTSPSTGSATNNSEPTFTWGVATDPAPSSGITYTLQIDTSSSFNSGNLRTITGLTSTSYTPGTALTDGTWYWHVRAVDNAGNTGSYSGYWSIVVDTVAPGLPTLTSPSNGSGTNNNRPTFTWSAATDATSGVANYTLQIDTTGSFDNATGKLRTITGLTTTTYTPATVLTDGTWYWRVRAIDRAGNLGSYSGSWSLIVDTVAPGLPTLSSPSNGAIVGVSSPTFTWVNATDATSGIASHTLQYSKDIKFLTGVVTVTGLGSSYTPTGSPLSDGTWYWRVRAVDKAGNTGSYCANWSILIDTVAPSLPTLTAPSTGSATNNSEPTFTWGVATDPAPSSGITYTLQIDTSSSFNSGDLRTITGLTSTSYTPGTALTDGTWYWHVRAVDNAGNTGSYSGYWSIVVDTVVPDQPTLSSPGSGTQTNITLPTLVWNSATDATSGVANYTLQLDTSSSFNSGNLRTLLGLTGTSYTLLSALSQGNWYWRVRAVDRAGNAGSYSGYWNFTVDTQPPTILALSRMGGNYTNTLTITLTISVSGAQKMYLSNDGTNWVEYSYVSTKSWNLTAGDGVKHVYFKCKDAAGNWAYLSGGFISITLDTVPPTAGSPSVPATGAVVSDNRTALGWNAGSDIGGSGIAKYTVQLDTSPLFNNAGGERRTVTDLTTTNYTVNPALSGGTWYWRFNATDRAGNTGSYSTFSWFILNTTLPSKIPYDLRFWQPDNDSASRFPSPQFAWNSTILTGAYRYHIQIDRYLNFSSSYLIENLTLPATRLALVNGTWLPYFSPLGDNNKLLTDGVWYWRVEAINLADARSGFLTVQKLTIDTAPPDAPTLLAPVDLITTKAKDHILFSWSAVPGAVSYWLQFDWWANFSSGDVPGFTFINLTKNSIVYNRSLWDANWYWHVLSLDSLGNINNSIRVPLYQFMIDTGSPSPPSPLSPSQGYFTNRTTPTIAWYPAADPAIGGVSSGVADYTLSLDNGSSFNSPNLRTIAGVVETNYTLTSPLSDGTWYWFVNATDEAGNIGPGSIIQSFTVDTVAPTPPNKLTMSPNGNSLDYGKVTFEWGSSNDTSGITVYMIQIDTSDRFDNSSGNLLQYETSGNSYTAIKELSNGQYYWRIAAKDGAGNLGDWSDGVPFVVNVVKGLPLMTIILVGGGSSGVAILAVLGYVFYRRAKIPFVIKKIDQSIKLITKGEMPAPVPMRSRAEIVQTIFQDKIAILSKERVEEREKKKGKEKPREPEEPKEMKAPQEKAKEAEVKSKEVGTKLKVAKAAALEEADVDMIVKELEKLETTKETGPSKESDFIKRETEELEKPKKKKD